MQTNIEEITEIFRDVFDNPNLVIAENTVAGDVEEWDSLNHIQLVVTVEKHFKIKFTAREIYVWKNVGDIINSIEAKLKSN